MRLPLKVQQAMEMEVEAERRRRAVVAESEGIRQAEINIAEGRKQVGPRPVSHPLPRQARILESEAEQQQVVLAAQGEAQAVVAAGEARAR